MVDKADFLRVVFDALSRLTDIRNQTIESDDLLSDGCGQGTETLQVERFPFLGHQDIIIHQTSIFVDDCQHILCFM